MSEQQPAKSKRQTHLATRLLYSVVAGLLLGIAALAIYLYQDSLRQPQPVNTGHFEVLSEATFDGVIEIDPPLAMPDFSLTNQYSERVSLIDLRGRYVLLTFGFTHCPDICPLTLNDYQRIGDMLGGSAGQVHFVFVSVDGKRDTPEALQSYLSFRKLERIIGLTGDEDAVRALGEPYGLSFAISDQASGGSYAVNHTAGSFLLDPLGRWVKRFHFGVPPSAIAAELETMIAA